MRPETTTPFYLTPEDPPAKRAMLQAALRLFVSKGLCATSIRAIAAESGYTNPALFKHFESKEALALHLFEQCYQRYARELNKAAGAATGFRGKLHALLERFALLYDESPEAFLYLNDNLQHFWPQVGTALRRKSLVRLITKLVEEGQEGDMVRRDVSSPLLVAGIIGTLSQVARLIHFGELNGRASEYLDDLEALVLAMVTQ